MSASNVEGTVLRPFCVWDVEAIVETRGSCEAAGDPEALMTRLVQAWPFDE